MKVRLTCFLTLIQKNKVSIYDIPIVEITAQYLEAIDGIEEANLDNTKRISCYGVQSFVYKIENVTSKMRKKRTRKTREKNFARRLAEYQQFKRCVKGA